MLRNEPQEESQNTPVLPPGQRRVTPEELTAALEALESSKQEQARQVQQTVAIGDVVEELGLNVTPEEVWQQVQAQRAQKAAPPPPPAAESKQADAINETLHEAAQNARKLAGQASATAMAAASEVLTAAEHRRSQHGINRRRGSRLGVMLALLASGWLLFSGSHGVMVNSDHATLSYGGSRGIAVVTGDNDAVTFTGNCDTLVVVGDHDKITVTGTVKQIISPGDHNTVTWTQRAGDKPASITDFGDGNRLTPADGGPPPTPAPSPQ